MKFGHVLFFSIAFLCETAPLNEGVSLLQIKKLSSGSSSDDLTNRTESTNAVAAIRGVASGERAGPGPLLAEFTRSPSQNSGDPQSEIKQDGIRGLCVMGHQVAEFEGSAEDCIHLCNNVYGPDGQCDFFNYCPATKWTRYMHLDSYTRCEVPEGENIVVVQNILECEQQAEALGREFISYLEEDGVKTCFSSAACNAAVDEGPRYSRYKALPDHTKCERPKSQRPFYVQNQAECFGRARTAGKPWATYYEKSKTDKRCYHTHTCDSPTRTNYDWNIYKAEEGKDWKVYKYQTALSPELSPLPDPQ